VAITTRVIPVDPLKPDPYHLDDAARVIRAGGLVAFATETVYGLGADATNPAAVARIFEAKGRPATNPLIVHVYGVAMACDCVADWPVPADALAVRFWPGPLTLVLPRGLTIPDIVTAGQATVGVRVPRSLVALGLITHSGVPIAAPSANRSAGVSPTLARHVLEDLDGRVELILDSGQTSVGIESTVLDLTTREPHVLRPGPITAREIEQVLGGSRVRDAVGVITSDRPASPGQMAIHYAPRTRAVRVEAPGDLDGFPWPRSAALLVIGPHDLPSLPADLKSVTLRTPEDAARDLYVVLRQLDALALQLFVILPPPNRAEWHAIRDRLWRATTPASR